jgi:hypothetical protein
MSDEPCGSVGKAQERIVALGATPAERENPLGRAKPMRVAACRQV